MPYEEPWITVSHKRVPSPTGTGQLGAGEPPAKRGRPTNLRVAARSITDIRTFGNPNE